MSALFSWIRFSSIPWIVSLLLVLAGGSRPAWAAAPEVRPVQRKILALFDANEGIGPDTSKIFENCQTVLNYLGMIVDYRDVNQPLPDPRAMAQYRGILTWFESDGIPNPKNYLNWLSAQVARKTRLAVLGSMGFSEADLTPELRDQAKAVYAHLGMAHRNDFTSQRVRLRYGRQDRAMVNFERPYPPVPMQYDQFTPLDDTVQVHLSLTRTDRTGAPSAVVATSPGGGMAWGPYILWREGTAPYRKQWYVNPFAFFTAAFDLAAMPKPDVTTLNGRRIAFSHIDGDAFGGFSEVRKDALCADVIREHILERYRFPVTVSVIVAEIDPTAMGNDRRVALARDIYALSNVEPASHAYSHPFYWDPDFDNTVAEYPSQYGMKIPGYEFDAAMEIDYSVRYINEQLAPPEKPCRVFLWTGNCKPLAEHVRRCDQLNLLNMNGGDTLFDAVNNSYTGVAPIYRDIGGYYQFHIGQANENILTNLWQGPYYGYREIITTMTRTGIPRRIKPIDIYYHFYSGQYEASLNAVETVYDWVLSQPVFPMFTSAYLRIARSWLDGQLQGNATGDRYTVTDYGHCLTLRFDDHDDLPDLARCRNILGYFRDAQGLYVHLDPDENAADIVLSRAPAIRPHLQTANGWIRGLEIGPDRIVFRFEGFGPGQVVLAGLGPQSRWVVGQGESAAQGTPLTVDDEGRLVLSKIVNGRVEIGRR